jgi:hypothetical protein
MSTSVVSIPVTSSGFGAAVDVSSLAGAKTVALSGKYRGSYVLYGSHQSGTGARFAPLLIFDAGGIESIKQTFNLSLAQVRLKSLAQGAVGVSASMSGLSESGDNSFTSLGVGGVVDLGTDAYQVDLNFMGFGSVRGVVVVEGSLDGFGFNPIGEFASESPTSSLLAGIGEIEFSPVVTKDRVRYVRFNVQGSTDAGFLVTVGGAKDEGGGGAATLAVTYNAGSLASDQIMRLADVKGGQIVIDATEVGFTDTEALQVLIPGGIGAAFKKDGGMRLGLDGGTGNVLINCSAGSPLGDPSYRDDVSIGNFAGVTVPTGFVVKGRAVVIGALAIAPGNSVCIGYHAICDDESNVSVGSEAFCRSRLLTNLDQGNVLVGTSAQQRGSTSVTVGDHAQSFGDIMVCIGNRATIGTPLTDNVGGIAIGSGASVVGDNGIAIGVGAYNSAAEGMAMGHGSAAGANEVVFENSISHVKIFRAVSSNGGKDLFRFKEADLGAHNVTNFSLLIEDNSGTISIKQVTLSAPVGGVSTLQVSNP